MANDLTDGYIYVDYNHMQNAADDMVQQTHAIARTIDSLNAELGELVKTWEGDDSEEYKKKQAAWNNAVVEMRKLLSSNAALLTEISDNYRYSENSLAQLWSDVKVGR
ncbi:WXG100 family type VII secretion target [Streptomyces anthocyanicus]|uniref:WXG100 family type VII secretion target n=1 Tax=Streptomyces anthocyanicus TaxID=68174 RepID=UPI002F91683E|nr:WXG100 family type VII secretion target [Streptomyces anthocyanicus]